MEQDTNAATGAENEETIVFDAEDFGGEADAHETSEETQEAEQDTNESPEAEPTREDVQDTNAQHGTETTQEDTGDGLEVNYLGERRKLTRQEAAEYAQKGMNYDHVKEQLDAMRNNALYRAAAASAKSAGMTEEEFAAQLSGQLKDREINKIAKERSVDEETARAIYEDGVKANAKLKQAEQTADDLKGELDELREYKRVNEVREEMRRQWKEFTAAHPDIRTLDDLPQEVIDAVKGGEEPETAYNRYEVKQLKEQLTRQQAKAKSAGSARGTADEEEGDFFLRGFRGDY